MKHKKDLLGLITLVKQNIIFEKSHKSQFWNQIYQKLLRLISEKLNCVDDCAMGCLDHVGTKSGWKAGKQSFPISVVFLRFRLIFEVLFNFILSRRRQINFS